MLSFTSWMFTTGEILRPLLTGLVFTEPFLILYAIVNGPLSLRHKQFLWKLSLAIPFMQLSLALWQTLILGLSNPDLIQGTFVSMGNGHHVSGGIALIGVLICMARGVSAPILKKRATWLFGALALFLIPILSDAKQNIIAFLPAASYLLITMRGSQDNLRRGRWTALVIALVIFAVAIYTAFLFYPPLQIAVDWSQLSHGLQGKMGAILIIIDKMSHRPGEWLFGLGPGNSVSRVALMAMGDYIRTDSPVAFLGLATARTTEEIWDMTFSDSFFARSSVWSGISSWFGLFGDLGLTGLLIYLWMCWRIWRSLGDISMWQSGAAKSAFIMTGLLGGIYSWLEEPGFTFPIALIVGLALIENAKAMASRQKYSEPSSKASWRKY
jgi:hypothetical protein